MRFLLSVLFLFSLLFCFISFVVDAASPPSSATLSNPNSSPATVALYKYLISQYGKKVISGQQEIAEINYIKSVSGLEPALGAFDLMDYSPSRRESHRFFGQANPSGDFTTEAWINWARGWDGKKLGIVSLCWHWNAPTDLYDSQESGKEWYSGFYTKATSFNIASVLAAGSSDWRYQLILRDIDTIATELKKLRDNDIPVLWRPLHEAYGKWFWWGAQGSSAFKQLWGILYDRLTNYHGLNNLIWVYNGEASSSSSWTPDESKWDIYSLDLYLPNNSKNPASWSSEWNNVVNKYNGKRLIALSETGSLPTPSTVRSSNTYWSYAVTWYGDFIKSIDQNRIRTWMGDTSLVITRSSIDDWRNMVFIPPVFSIVLKNNNNRVFDISEHNNNNGTPLIMWTPTNGDNQKFEWVYGEQIRWYQTDKCLDVKDGNNVNGNLIFIWQCSSNNNNNNQKFYQRTVSNGVYQIEWKNTGKCLDVINDSAGSRVQIYDCNSSRTSQLFTFQ